MKTTLKNGRPYREYHRDLDLKKTAPAFKKIDGKSWVLEFASKSKKMADGYAAQVREGNNRRISAKVHARVVPIRGGYAVYTRAKPRGKYGF